MDLSKAFDTINHDLLTTELHAYGFLKEPLKLIKIYLKNCWQWTEVNLSFSSFRTNSWSVRKICTCTSTLQHLYKWSLLLNWINRYLSLCWWHYFSWCDSDIEDLTRRLEHFSMLVIEFFESNCMKWIKINVTFCYLVPSMK